MLDHVRAPRGPGSAKGSLNDQTPTGLVVHRGAAVSGAAGLGSAILLERVY